MRFPDLLITATKNAEIPLRFEPGADEAMAKAVTGLLRVWIAAHTPADPSTEFDFGRKALVEQLLDEIDGTREVPE